MINASVTWTHYPDQSVDLTFRNYLTNCIETRHYKTRRGAKCAETKFYSRISRVYREQQRFIPPAPAPDYDGPDYEELILERQDSWYDD